MVLSSFQIKASARPKNRQNRNIQSDDNAMKGLLRSPTQHGPVFFWAQVFAIVHEY